MDTFRSAAGLPEPESATVAIPPSLLMVSVPPAGPVLVGANCTPIWQLPPGEMAVPPVHPSAETVNGPLTLVPATVRSLVPELVTVTLCGLLIGPIGTVPNARLPGLTAIAGATPVPDSATVSGLDAALLVMVRVPERVPVAVGEKVTAMAQAWPGSTGCAVQPVASAVKSPDAVASRTVRLVVPVLATAIVSGWLVVPTACLPKSRLVEERLTCGLMPVPVSGSVCVPSIEVLFTARLAVRSPVADGVKAMSTVQEPPAGTLNPEAVLAHVSDARSAVKSAAF